MTKVLLCAAREKLDCECKGQVTQKVTKASVDA